jgi:hypothetical protein
MQHQKTNVKVVLKALLIWFCIVLFGSITFVISQDRFSFEFIFIRLTSMALLVSLPSLLGFSLALVKFKKIRLSHSYKIALLILFGCVLCYLNFVLLESLLSSSIRFSIWERPLHFKAFLSYLLSIVIGVLVWGKVYLKSLWDDNVN